VGISDCRFDGPGGGFAEIGLMDPKGMGMTAPDMFKLSTKADQAKPLNRSLAWEKRQACEKEEMTHRSLSSFTDS